MLGIFGWRICVDNHLKFQQKELRLGSENRNQRKQKRSTRKHSGRTSDFNETTYQHAWFCVSNIIFAIIALILFAKGICANVEKVKTCENENRLKKGVNERQAIA